MRPNVSSFATLGKPSPQADYALLGPQQGFVAKGPGFRVSGWWGEIPGKTSFQGLEFKQMLFSII